MPADVYWATRLLKHCRAENWNQKRAAFTILLLADEINRAPAKTPAALLEVIARISNYYRWPELLPCDLPFMVHGDSNPMTMKVTLPFLPEAETDRFLMKSKVITGHLQTEVSLTLANLQN